MSVLFEHHDIHGLAGFGDAYSDFLDVHASLAAVPGRWSLRHDGITSVSAGFSAK
jgi:hypothetical protein